MKPPLILSPGNFSQSDLEALKKNHKIWKETDIYDSQVKELAEIRFPADPSAQTAFIHDQPTGETAGAWVYYPWSGVLLHCVGEAELAALRTNRNKNLVTAEEQAHLAKSSVAVAGMSVGAGIALGCAYSGMSDHLKLADFDDLETANLNRLRESLSNVGSPKIELAARHIYELNPFAELELYADGIDDQNITAFFTDPKIAAVIDEIDDFKMKIRLRLEAKRAGVPLLMFTSLGDNILVDVERYDEDPQLPLFNGAIEGLPEEILDKSDISPEDMKRYAVQLVGEQYVPTKALASLGKIGTELVGRPQLYSTIAVDGGLAAYLVRAILLGEAVKSGRYFIKFAELFGMTAADLAATADRQTIIKRLLGNG